MKNFMRKHPFLFAAGLFLTIALLFGTASLFQSRSWNEIIPHAKGDIISDISVEYFTEDGEASGEELLELTEVISRETSTVVRWRAASAGCAELRVSYQLERASGEEGRATVGSYIRVNRFGVISVGEGLADYAGFPVVYYGITLYALLMTAYLLWLREVYQKESYYSYEAMASLSGAIFFGILSLVYLFAILTAALLGEQTSVKLMMVLTSNLTTAYLVLTVPFLTAFSLVLAVSNIELIRHEGKRLSNMLGILAGILLTGGTGTVAALFVLNTSIGSDYPAIPAAYAMASACVSIFQAMLIGAVISCLRAGYRKAPYDRQFIIILGCGIRKDGTLYPLIRGRVDRAIAYWKEQAEKTGEKAVFVPSGGQGPDEVMAEAEAMKRYLLEQGIPEEYILPETKSSNTLENMRFSKALIEGKDPDAKVLFATTNYHIFRSGILAEKAGLKAEGIGSKTKWYFWPNALLREVVGMFAVQPKMQLLATLGLMLLAGAFGYIYSRIG